MPDSIMMKMTERSFLPPVTPKDEVVTLLTSWNTLKILNTIRPVTEAFTVMDVVRQVRASILSHSIVLAINSVLPNIHITRSNKSRSASESR
jgi:hypothetical protein